MSECSGEQIRRPLNLPHALLPRSLMVLRLRLYGGDQRSDTSN